MYNDNGTGACADVQNGKQGQTTNTVGGEHASSGAVYEVACKNGMYNDNGPGGCQGVDSDGAYAETGAEAANPCPDGEFNLDGDNACADVQNGKQGQTTNTVGGEHASS